MEAETKPYVVVTKPIGAICNLNCVYCFYLKKQDIYPNKKVNEFRMSDKVLAQYIRQYIEQPSPEITFVWQGGEPTLMGIEFFEKAIRFQKDFNHEKKIIHNSFQTNAVNIDDRWAMFFKKNNALIGVSLDGPEILHNKYRFYKGGKGSFKDAMKGIAYLRKYNVDYNILCTVNHFNGDHPIDIYNFLDKNSGSDYWQFIPIVERLKQGGPEVTNFSVSAEQYGNFLIHLFNRWIRNDIGRKSIQIIDVTFRQFMGLPPGLCLFSETCGSALAIEHNGDLYSCDHYVDKEYYLGNIMETTMQKMVGSKKQTNFGKAKKTMLPVYCQRCEVLHLCNGGCPKNRFIKTPDGSPGLNYLCKGYKKFFTYVTPYMEFLSEMYRRKIPFKVSMDYINAHPFEFISKIKEEDPCYCGSGKKYGECCGSKL